ncbi:MAG: PAS domain S-box protein, partial [Bacteroidetes bacterium]|nr:PAS domain S-box protein [Bacteroidota bacterium]
VNKYNVQTKGNQTSIELFYSFVPPFKIDFAKLDEWRNIFRNEPAVSPYEELKRKNTQLQDLSESFRKSEARYKTLTNSLPMIIFSLDTQGALLYANEWLFNYTGQSLESLNDSRWKNVVHTDEYDAFALVLNNEVARGASTMKIQARIKQKSSGEYLWHQISFSPLKDDGDQILNWIGYIVDIHAQKVFEETLRDNIGLKQAQQKLRENQLVLESYIEELNRSNLELQQFAFVASHDLQEPVRKLLFYSDYLLRKYSSGMDAKGGDYLSHMHHAAERMRSLIQALLIFSQINKAQVELKPVDLNEIVNDARQDMEIAISEKKAVINVDELPVIDADQRMMRQLFENIIGNSLKYAKKTELPVIDITCRKSDGFVELGFKDNGIGFDQQFLPQMFMLFQRLHAREIYEGTGLGLAICRKIVEMHKGRIWAEGKEGEGATFYVSLPAMNN